MPPSTTTASGKPATSSATSAGPSVRGRFLWHELLARDKDSAVAFYPKVLPWSVTTMSQAEGIPPYTMFVNGEAPIAGVMPYPNEQLSAGARSMWLPYMGTEDVDATCAAAKAKGAKELMSPMDIPTVGRIAVLADPQGANFALFKPSMPAQPEAAPNVGEFAWHELAADEPTAAFDFYAALFGWKKTEAMDMGSDGIYQMFGQDGFTYGGMSRRRPDAPASFWNTYIRVADLDAACDAVRRQSGTIVMGPHEVPGGDRIVVCHDDQQTTFSLVGRIKK